MWPISKSDSRPDMHGRAVVPKGYCAAFALLLSAIAFTAHAEKPDDLVRRYAALVKQEDPSFEGFSAERGKAFYFEKHVLPGLGEVNCASCHLEDPRKQIRAHRVEILCRACHVINQEEHPDPNDAKKRYIEPFTPTVNHERFNDFEKVNRYFDVNCKMVMKRVCTAKEKGDLIAWLLTVK